MRRSRSADLTWNALVLRMVVIASALILVAVTACARDQAPPATLEPVPSASSVPAVEQPESGASDAIPADEVFSQVPPGFAYEKDETVERVFEAQFKQILASAPDGVELDGVAARRVLDDSGEVQGSVLVISMDIADPSLVPQFQEGLIGGLGDGVREIDVGGVPAYYKQDFTANGQDLVLFFHEETVAVEVYGIVPRVAKEIAAAMADTLME